MTYEYLLHDEDNGITTLTLNRPERLNALNARIGEELLDAIKNVEDDNSQRVLILTGAGRGFCSGDDLKGDGSPRQNPGLPLDRVKRFLGGPGRWPLIAKALLELPKPVIAMINGAAYGAGFELALAADFRIASQNAVMSFPVNQRGLLWGIAQLPRLVGMARAKEILMLNNALTSEQAHNLGLVTEVVPHDQLQERTTQIALQLAEGPVKTYALIKKGLHQSIDSDLYHGYEHQAYALTLNGIPSEATPPENRSPTPDSQSS